MGGKQRRGTREVNLKQDELNERIILPVAPLSFFTTQLYTTLRILFVTLVARCSGSDPMADRKISDCILI